MIDGGEQQLVNKGGREGDSVGRGEGQATEEPRPGRAPAPEPLLVNAGRAGTLER